MRMYDLIDKKKNGEVLDKAEIEWIIKNYTDGDIPDYQMSAFLMAVYFRGMNKEEIYEITMAMAKSGDMMDLTGIEGFKVDKHSTGGVGDKTTLIIAPIVAACGGKVAKMSGKGLGFTGGTIDKLESINGFKTSLLREEFIENVNKIGVSVVGQTGNLTPADKKIYALRDVTATVDCIPLIASSIMSKKIAAGSDGILLDVKMGSGAFMNNLHDAIELTQIMLDIGKKAGRNMAALITDMDVPLGKAIGNALEVEEAIEVLKGEGELDLKEICITLATYMLYISKKGTLSECEKMVIDAIISGKAYDKFVEMVKAQGGELTEFKKAKYSMDIISDVSGYVGKIDTKKCGIVSVILEAGRETKESIIDYSAGIVLNKKYGDTVKKGETLATIYTNNSEKLENASKLLKKSYTIINNNVEKKPIIIAKKINC